MIVPATGFTLRGRQPEWLAAIHEDLKIRSRLLCIAPGGVGKTTLFAALASDMWKKGVRTLVLENRDRLTEQTADRIRKETGLDVDIEKGDQRASPHAPVVVACVPSIAKIPRLTGFSANHFGLVVPDECHLALAPSWLRVLNYFHYGPESLAEDWQKPKDGTYRPLASIVGFTASPDLGLRRNLGELFQGPEPTVNYSYLDAISEGWLVGIVEKNIPIKIDTRNFRVKRSEEGDSFSVEDQNAALMPIVNKLAAQIVEYASDRKTMAFVPSVEIASKMSDELSAMGLNSCFVSGECIDKNEKTDNFAAAGRGSVLVNCSIYTYGVDFPDVSCVAPFGAFISKVKYFQSIYRGTRVLPGVIKEWMDAEARLAAIAESEKRDLLVLSPMFHSERHHICEPFDLFCTVPDDKKARKKPDMTKPEEIRNFIKSLEKELDKHQHKQPRTIDPVRFALSIGDNALAHYVPVTASDEAPASKEALDFLLSMGLSTVAIRNAGEANLAVSRLRERQRLGLASPKQLTLLKQLGFAEDKVMLVSMKQAGAIIGQRFGRR